MKTDPYGFYAPIPKVNVHIYIEEDSSHLFMQPCGPDDPEPNNPSIAIDLDLWRSYLAYRDSVLMWQRILNVLLERQDRDQMLKMEELEKKEQDES